MKLLHRVGILLAVLIVSGCTGNATQVADRTQSPATAQPPQVMKPTPGAEAAPMGSTEAAAWDAVLSNWVAAQNPNCDAPGGVLLVDTPGGRYLKAAGVASLDTSRPVRIDDRFQIGSNTKAFTVALALLLQEEGVLSLDDPLSKWLPDLAARIPNGAQITLRQMAGNVSGIWDYADPLMQPLIDANDQQGIAKAYSPQALVEYAIANGKPDFAPGKGWHYSSTNFILLGMVLEAATGKSLAQLYQERIFAPLGMQNTSYQEASPTPGSIIDGYYAIPGAGLTNMTQWNASQGGAAGAIVSTAEDMARFAAGLFDGKLFRNKASLDEMLNMRKLGLLEGGGVMDGYGLGVMQFSTPGLAAYGHGGQTPGFQSVWLRVPKANASLILLTNSGSCHVLRLPPQLTPKLFGLPAATP